MAREGGRKRGREEGREGGRGGRKEGACDGNETGLLYRYNNYTCTVVCTAGVRLFP